MEKVLCACGCGEEVKSADRQGRARFIRGHQNRKSVRTEKQKQAVLKNIRKAVNNRGEVWNKGLSYVHRSKTSYAHKGSWRAALLRIYGDICMICSWNLAPCDTHHIEEKSDGGCFELANGIVLCPNCHRLAHNGLISAEDMRIAKDVVDVSSRFR
jgi:predicted HNH restriction endonuclease